MSTRSFGRRANLSGPSRKRLRPRGHSCPSSEISCACYSDNSLGKALTFASPRAGRTRRRAESRRCLRTAGWRRWCCGSASTLGVRLAQRPRCRHRTRRLWLCQIAKALVRAMRGFRTERGASRAARGSCRRQSWELATVAACQLDRGGAAGLGLSENLGRSVSSGRAGVTAMLRPSLGIPDLVTGRYRDAGMRACTGNGWPGSGFIC